MTQKQAFTTIVAGPIHLVGEAAQVETFYKKGKGQLPPWWDEWDQLLGDSWGMDILESPSDVARFMQATKTDPAKPRVGFISNSKLKLESGVGCGGEDRDIKAVAAKLHAYWQILSPAMQDRYKAFASVGTIEGLLYRRDRYMQDRYASNQAEIELVEQLNKQAKADKAKAEGSVAANDEAQPSPLPVGEIWRITKPVQRYGGVACSHCGRLARTNKGIVMEQSTLKRKGFASIRCAYCNEPLGQKTRERDNVQDRGLPVFDSAEWAEYAYDHEGNRVIPWGERPRSNPRMALASFIARRYPQRVDLYIHDEVHECKGARTALAKAMGALVSNSRKTVGLTGTLYGGYASTLYYLLLRLGNTVIRDRWGWDNCNQFVDDVGVVDVINKEITRDAEAGHFDGKSKTVTEKRERAGITAELMTIVQNCAYNVLLKHMGFNLPQYNEDVVLLDMPTTIKRSYKEFENDGKKVIADGGYDALSAYLQGTLIWPYQPWRQKVVASKFTDEVAVSGHTTSTLVLPHHEYLAQHCADHISDGRRVLIFAEHTGSDDICEDIRTKVTKLALDKHGIELKIAVLRSTTVKPGERNAWFQQRASEGVNVVICNPRLVKTGLNLIQWPSIVVLEPIYSLYDLFQAKRRGFRPTQTKSCDVTFLGYKDTMSERALSVVARKAAAAAIMNGDSDAGGLLEFDPGMGLLQELAKQIRASIKEGTVEEPAVDIHALFAQSAAAIKADAEGKTVEYLGIINPIKVDMPPVSMPEVVPNITGMLAEALQHQFTLVTKETTITKGKAKGKVVQTQQFAMTL